MIQDTDEELREIKREIVESRGLIIKTNNLTSALSADLKSIARRQQEAERKAFWNTAAGSGLFLLILIGVVKFAWDARVESVLSEAKGARERMAKAERELKEYQKRAEDRVRAEALAATFYELVRSGKRKEMLESYDALRKEPLTRAELAFFNDAVEKARSELSVRSYQDGLAHIRNGHYHEAAQALEHAIGEQDNASHVADAKLNLARVYRKLNRQRDAIPLLLELTEHASDRDELDDATFLLAECYADIQAWNDAKATLKAFIRKFPESSMINDAKMALSDISLKH